MDRNHAAEVLRDWDRQGRHVFTRQQLARLFPGDSPKTFAAGLNRLVRAGLLVRACRGVYVNPHAHSLDSRVIERIAQALRPGAYSYVSLESLLSETGAISQILLDRLTVMTTGRKGVYRTPYGVIEFTHTKRPASEVLTRIRRVEGRPLRVASPSVAWRDLKRVGRNVQLVDPVACLDG
ncbi:MAG: type IV toxin-antitoxin system AbiEi family antitoxin domain-containing protein [Steroidobacteraceae bacterium]